MVNKGDTVYLRGMGDLTPLEQSQFSDDWQTQLSSLNDKPVTVDKVTGEGNIVFTLADEKGESKIQLSGSNFRTTREEEPDAYDTVEMGGRRRRKTRGRKTRKTRKGRKTRTLRRKTRRT